MIQFEEVLGKLPHEIANCLAVSLNGEIPRIGTPGLPLAARKTVDPRREKHTIDFALIVVAIYKIK